MLEPSLDGLTARVAKLRKNHDYRTNSEDTKNSQQNKSGVVPMDRRNPAGDRALLKTDHGRRNRNFLLATAEFGTETSFIKVTSVTDRSEDPKQPASSPGTITRNVKVNQRPNRNAMYANLSATQEKGEFSDRITEILESAATKANKAGRLAKEWGTGAPVTWAADLLRELHSKDEGLTRGEICAVLKKHMTFIPAGRETAARAVLGKLGLTEYL